MVCVPAVAPVFLTKARSVWESSTVQGEQQCPACPHQTQGTRSFGKGREIITITHLCVCSSVSALVRELHHSRDHTQRQTDGKSEEEPTQSLGLQRAPAVSAPMEATGLPPLVTEVVEITRFTQFEDSNGELLSPWRCW